MPGPEKAQEPTPPGTARSVVPMEADATAMGFLVNAIVDLRIPEEHYDFQSRLAARHYPDM